MSFTKLCVIVQGAFCCVQQCGAAQTTLAISPNSIVDLLYTIIISHSYNLYTSSVHIIHSDLRVPAVVIYHPKQLPVLHHLSLPSAMVHQLYPASVTIALYIIMSKYSCLTIELYDFRHQTHPHTPE